MTLATTGTARYDDLDVGDRVWCLAWVGLPFDVVGKDDELQAVAIETPPGWPTYARVDLLPETMFLLTTEQWDTLWHWPDRAGERYLDVFERFVEQHHVGQVVSGQIVATGLDALRQGMAVTPDPARAMAFRIDALDRGFGQIRVHPVVAFDDGTSILVPSGVVPDDAWVRVGPTVPLRMEMRTYRWHLTFGELSLTWSDEPAASGP